MTDARCKKEYHETKKKIIRDPVKFMPKTKKQKPVKKIFKAIVEDDDDEVPTPPTSDEEEEPKKDMPEVLQKMIQDFARPRPKKMETKEILARPFNIGFYQFGEDRDKDEALLNEFDGTTREILKYMYYFPKKELFIELYQIPDDAVITDFEPDIDRVYIMPEVNNFIYSFNTLGYVVDSRHADTDIEGDYEMMEVDVRNKENFDLYANKWKKPLEKAKEKLKKEKKEKKKAKEEKEKSKKEKPKEKPKEKAKDKELVEKAKKQLAIMNNARDRGIAMDEDMREHLEEIVKGSGLPKSKFDWFM
jgi:hypothetical protein